MLEKDSVPSATAERVHLEHSEALESVMYVGDVTELDDKSSAEAVNNLATASNWNISDRTMDEHLDSHLDYNRDDDESIGEFDDSL